MFCMQCGKKIPDDSTFCPFCGAPVIRDESEQDTQIRPAAPKKRQGSLEASSAPAQNTNTEPAKGSVIEKPQAAAVKAPETASGIKKPETADADVKAPAEAPPLFYRPAAERPADQISDAVSSAAKASAGETFAADMPGALNAGAKEAGAWTDTQKSGKDTFDGVSFDPFSGRSKRPSGQSSLSSDRPVPEILDVGMPTVEIPAADMPDAGRPLGEILDDATPTVEIPAADMPDPGPSFGEILDDAAPTVEIPAADLPDTGPSADGFRNAGPSADGFRDAGPSADGFRDAGPSADGFRDAGPSADGFRDTDLSAGFSEGDGASGGNPGVPPAKKGKGGKKAFLIIGGVAVLVILALILFRVFDHNAKVKKYNEGVAQMESKDYDAALKTFTELGSFDDSEYMASFAQMELDYLTLDDEVKAGNYSRVVEILESRSEFYADSEIGEQAAALAKEYGTVSEAYEAKDSGNYAEAAEKFESLDTIRNDYGKDKCMCRAHVAESEQNWSDIIVNLYAVQSSDYDLAFLEDPQSDEAAVISESVASGEALEPDTAAEILQTDTDEAEALKGTAIKGLKYDAAKAKLDAGKYEDAMTAFEELGDFLDSAECYTQAKDGYDALQATYDEAGEHFENEEYYQARELYLSISDFKDAAEKAESCKQPLPENGALKKGNGGIAFTITAPDIGKSVFVKIYDSDGDTVGQVFLHSGSSSTVSMAAGSYTIKVAYGTDWYGEKDLFGDDGIYYQLLNGSSEQFGMENGYTYTLELLVSTDGNVGSESLGGAGDM